MNHRVPTIQASVRVGPWLPKPLKHILLGRNLTMGQLSSRLLSPIFENSLSHPSVTIFGQVPVRSLVALLLANDHRVLQITLGLLEADVLLVHLGIVHVPSGAVDDTGLWYSRVITE